MKNFFTTLRKTELRYHSFMLLFMLAATVSSISLVVMNRLSGEMSEAAVIGDVDVLVRFIIFITGVMLIRALASAVSTLTMFRFSASAGYKLRASFINHFLRVPFSKVEKVPSGERLSIYSVDIPRAESFVSTGTLGLFADFISFISAFVFLLLISPSFTGILFLCAIGMLLLQFLLSKPIQKLSVKQSEESAKFNAVVNDSLQNLSVIAAYSLEDVVEERYMDAYNRFFAVTKRFARGIALLVGTMVTTMFSPLIVVFIVLALATIRGDMSVADFIAFVTTIMVAAGGIMQLGQNVGRLAELSAGAKRLNDNTADALEELEQNGIENGELKAFDINFNTVDFSYSEEEDSHLAVNSANFCIKSGSKVAIVGGSGSGKSTILKLLLGLYEPQSGTITIGEKSTSQFDKAALRNLFAYVPQDSFLFPESIGKNITLEGEITDMTRLEKACEDAGILDFINTLPNRFDGVLTEAAENVSGGQRQRIAMARAFYKNAPIILFDEATSSLDPATESSILGSFKTISSQKTLIMVSHRMSAISVCDTVIVMEDGKISGIGTHEELITKNDAYKNIYESKGRG